MSSRDFLYSLPSKISTHAVEGLETTFHFDLEGEGGGQYTVKIENGRVEVTEGLTGQPECVVKGQNESFQKMLSGELNPLVAILTGKIKISNQAVMMKYAKIFGLM